MEVQDEMSVMQIKRMAEWLQMHGHTAEEVLQCIDYIAGKAEKKEVKKEEPGAEKVDRPDT